MTRSARVWAMQHLKIVVGDEYSIESPPQLGTTRFGDATYSHVCVYIVAPIPVTKFSDGDAIFKMFSSVILVFLLSLLLIDVHQMWRITPQ